MMYDLNTLKETPVFYEIKAIHYRTEDLIWEVNREFLVELRARLDSLIGKVSDRASGDIRLHTEMAMKLIGKKYNFSKIKVGVNEVNPLDVHCTVTFAFKYFDERESKYKVLSTSFRLEFKFNEIDNHLSRTSIETDDKDLNGILSLCNGMAHTSITDFHRVKRVLYVYNFLKENGWELKYKDTHVFQDRSFRLVYSFSKGDAEVWCDGFELKVSTSKAIFVERVTFNLRPADYKLDEFLKLVNDIPKVHKFELFIQYLDQSVINKGEVKKYRTQVLYPSLHEQFIGKDGFFNKFDELPDFSKTNVQFIRYLVVVDDVEAFECESLDFKKEDNWKEILPNNEK